MFLNLNGANTRREKEEVDKGKAITSQRKKLSRPQAITGLVYNGRSLRRGTTFERGQKKKNDKRSVGVPKDPYRLYKKSKRAPRETKAQKFIKR